MAILKSIMYFGCGWVLAIGFLANGIYALARPEQWIQAKWTATRGFSKDGPFTLNDRLGIRFFGVFMLVAGIVFTTAISVVSFLALREWHEGRPLHFTLLRHFAG